MQSRGTVLLLFQNQLLLPCNLSDYIQYKAKLQKKGCIHKLLVQDVLCPIVLIVGQKASEYRRRLRCGSCKREFHFLKHFLLLVEWVQSRRKTDPLPWHPVIIPRYSADLNSLPQIGSYITKNKKTQFNLPTIPLCAWLCFLILQSRLNWSHTKAKLEIPVENFNKKSFFVLTVLLHLG